MIYRTHVKIVKTIDLDIYWLVQGIELPCLITEGMDFEDAKVSAKDAFSLLMVCYEEDNKSIPLLYNEDVKDIVNVNGESVVTIESEDTDEYRKFVSEYHANQEE